jgi:serine phosphatase RsbU (regulator of sigma subunit)
MFATVWMHRPRRERVLELSYWTIVISGGLHILQSGLAIAIFGQRLGGVDSTVSGWAIFGILPAHIIACSLLPWSARQAARPILPLILLNAIGVLLLPGAGWLERLAQVMLSPLAGAPGTLISWLKHTTRLNRFKMRFLQSRYGEIRRELVDARRIHEALFPRPIATGPLRLDYCYEPMLLIGGDYLYARFCRPRDASEGEPPAFNLVLLDVTGHGIAAALTVNRLYGEIERLFAEDPGARPGDVLRALNRYVHLTLATHSIYASALCVRIDQARGLLEYASGGHPPAFLRAVDGTIEELNSTAFVLGAAAAEDFDPAPERRPFGPGDALVAYTDGAIEARDDSGRTLGVRGVQRVLAGRTEPTAGWVARVFDAVANHRVGPAQDDTIVVEVSRPIAHESVPERRERSAARNAEGEAVGV